MWSEMRSAFSRFLHKRNAVKLVDELFSHILLLCRILDFRIKSLYFSSVHWFSKSHRTFPRREKMGGWVLFGAVFLNLCEAVIYFDKPKNLTPKVSYFPVGHPFPIHWGKLPDVSCQRRFSLEDFERFAFYGWCYRAYKAFLFCKYKTTV